MLVTEHNTEEAVMTVDEILRSKGHAVVTIGPDATLAEAINLLDRHRVGAVVVTADGHSVAGLLGEQDAVRAIAWSGPAVLKEPVRSVMSTDVVSCAGDDRVTRVMAFDDRPPPAPPAGAEGRRLADGIVSIGDAVKVDFPNSSFSCWCCAPAVRH